MAGRGDNNKHGSAGRGAANQSNQPFVTDVQKHPKSNHGDQTGNKPSRQQPKQQDPDAHRDLPRRKVSDRKETW